MYQKDSFVFKIFILNLKLFTNNVAYIYVLVQ